jgi:hypothetical protein
VLGGVVLLAAAGGYYFFVLTAEPEPLPVRAAIKPLTPPVKPAEPVDSAATPALAAVTEVKSPSLPEGAVIEPVVKAPTAPVAPKPAKALVATPAFRVWVENVRITGVAAGNAPRAIINGRLVRPGDLIDPEEGIVFDGLDTEQKKVIFKIKSGATLGKEY